MSDALCILIRLLMAVGLLAVTAVAGSVTLVIGAAVAAGYALAFATKALVIALHHQQPAERVVVIAILVLAPIVLLTF